jgi:hypothetical protein
MIAVSDELHGRGLAMDALPAGDDLAAMTDAELAEHIEVLTSEVKFAVTATYRHETTIDLAKAKTERVNRKLAGQPKTPHSYLANS